MSIESDATKWKSDVSRIRELDPNGVLLNGNSGNSGNVKEYFDAVATVFENGMFNAENTKRQLKVLRGRSARLSGKLIAEKLNSFINITERYATKTEDEFTRFVKALASNARPSANNTSVRTPPQVHQVQQPRTRVTNGTPPRTPPQPRSVQHSRQRELNETPPPRISPILLSRLNTFVSIEDAQQRESVERVRENPFAEDVVEEKTRTPWIVGIVLLLIGILYVGIYINENLRYSDAALGMMKEYNSDAAKSGVNNAGFVNGIMTDSRDGQTYKTVKIGEQIWMAENLFYKTEHSICFPNQLNGNKYGCLYTWGDAIDSASQYRVLGYKCGYGKSCQTILRQGICPEGWILPSDNDWKNLYATMGESIYSMQIKGTREWKLASDKYGFAVIPVEQKGTAANFWSSTEYDVHRAFGWSMYENSSSYNMGIQKMYKKSHNSIRCIKK